MEESFLSSLLDTSGNYFYFGKIEPIQRSFFSENFSKKNSTEPKYIQLYYGHELKPRHGGEVVRKNIAPDWLFPFILIILIVFT